MSATFHQDPSARSRHAQPAAPTGARRFRSFSEFYPFYLSEHRNRVSRRLHFAGSLLGLCWIIGMLGWGTAWLAPLGLVIGYAFAWVGHFVFEKNKPATFKHPLYSFMGDWAMFKDMAVGRIPF